MKCSMCTNNKTLKSSFITYKYKECGLDNVILYGVKKSQCSQCREVYHNFGDVEKLHQLIAQHLTLKDGILVDREIRFLRKYLGYSGSLFSKLVGYKAEHLSRLENGKATIQETFDRLVRALVLEKMPDRDYNLQDLFLEDQFTKLDRLEFSLSGNNWKIKTAA